jgi:hypothetical protein
LVSANHLLRYGHCYFVQNKFRSKTQEDILLIDRSISPPVLIQPNGAEGVYLRNSVLGRVEVKSTLTKTHLKEFRTSCDEFHNVPHDVDDERFHYRRENNHQLQNLNFIFAFDASTSDPRTAYEWLGEPDGLVSAVCISTLGFWKVGFEKGSMAWFRYECKTENPEAERTAAFAAFISNAAIDQHITFQGRDRLDSLEGGVGHYFNNWLKCS